MKISALFNIVIFITIFLIQSAQSQRTYELASSDSILYELEPITITAYRFPIHQNKFPFATTTIDKIQIQTLRQQLSLRESLVSLPGVFALNSNNYAQDLRLSIRGFGSRASFGIRGIRILIDGIPETTPDGQTQLDNINISIIDQIEILRGPVSALYGNASGGVMQFSSEAPPKQFMLNTRLVTGAYGFGSLQIKTGQDLDNFSYLVSGAHTRIDGYRDHSEMKNYLLNGIFKFSTDSVSTFTLRTGYENSPLANDPGGLTSDQSLQNPRQAYSGNLLYEAGESVTQGRIGLSFTREFNHKQKLQTTLYYTRRLFANRLPFEQGGMVELIRHFGGLNMSYFLKTDFLGTKSQIISGFELANQQDHRKRFNNLQGNKGDLVFDQNEIFSNIGIFFQQNINIISNWMITYGLRYDAVQVKAEDYYTVDSDNSDKKLFNGISAMFGVAYQYATQHNIYGNISTGFETPALIELSVNPDGGGFNNSLTAQQAINFELGLKGNLFKCIRYETALYSIPVFDEILPYELEGTPGRSYYHNAGESRHNGLELLLNGNLYQGIHITLNYTYSRFKFIDYITPSGNYSGNIIPGIPRHMFNTEIQYIHPQGIFSRVEIISRGALYTNNYNSAIEEAAVITNIQAGYTIVSRNWQLELFTGVNNLFNTRYSDNIRINAFGGRYYEPAPERHLFVGISVGRH